MTGGVGIALRFLALGALLFAAQQAWSRWTAAPPQVSRRIELPGGALDEEALADEILYREALRRGLDRDDPVVQQRLVQIMLGLSSEEGVSDAKLIDDARALGLDRSDIVVRRRLVQRMRMAIETAVRDRGVDEATLRAEFAREPGRFRQPEQLRLTQVFFDRARRGEHLDADATAARAQLRTGAPPASFGDAFPLSSSVGPQSQEALARAFGRNFAAIVFHLPPGEWSGPVTSPFGMHLVRVDEKIAAAEPPFEAVRDRVRRDILDARAREAVRDAVAEWKRDYEVVATDE